MTGRNFLLTTASRRILPDDRPVPMPRKGKVWIHITAESEAELLLLLKKFNIHGLTIEDMLNPQTRIKVESFPNYTFFTFRGMHFEHNHIFSKNFHFVTMKNILITVANEPRNTILDLIQNWTRRRFLLEQGPEFIIHYILDVETDHTLNIVLAMEDQVDDFERSVVEHEDERGMDIRDVFALRGNLQHIKRVINHHKEILDKLDVMKSRFYTDASEAFFRDVQDHQIRVLETVDNLIGSITLAMEVHLTISSRRTSDIMRILTILTSILLPMTFITGIYGMNFENLPFLHHPLGYVLSFLVMLGVGAGMLFYFYLKKWI